MDSPESRKLGDERRRKLAEIRVKIEEGERLSRELTDPDLSAGERGILEQQRERCRLTEREKTLLEKFEEEGSRRRLEQTLRNIPIEIFENAAIRHRIAATPHKMKAFFDKIGLPIAFGQKKTKRTFDFFVLIDWLLGEFIPMRIPGMESKDEVFRGISSIIDPSTAERLKIENVQAEIELKRIRIAKERGELVPVAQFAELVQTQAAIFNRFGEHLKTDGNDHLLTEFNDILDQFGHTLESVLDQIVSEKNNSNPEKQ